MVGPEGLGGISFSARGGRSYEGEGGIDREEYERMEHTIRVAARSFLHQPSTPDMLQTSLQNLIVLAQNFLDDMEVGQKQIKSLSFTMTLPGNKKSVAESLQMISL